MEQKGKTYNFEIYIVKFTIRYVLFALTENFFEEAFYCLLSPH